MNLEPWLRRYSVKKVPQIYIAISYMVVLMNFAFWSPGTKIFDGFSNHGSKFEPGVLSCVTGQRMYFVYKLEHTVPTIVPVYYSNLVARGRE